MSEILEIKTEPKTGAETETKTEAKAESKAEPKFDTKNEQPELAKHDAAILDLAFVMDCTGSMGSYIHSATEVTKKLKNL